MKRVIWTRQALEDVEAIRLYVARDSDRYSSVSRVISRLDPIFLGSPVAGLAVVARSLDVSEPGAGLQQAKFGARAQRP